MRAPRAELPTLDEIRAEKARRGLADFIPWASPRYSKPTHLAPVLSLLERAIAGEQVQAVVHAPPRHAKTESVVHAIPYGLRKRPELNFGYITYGASLARSKSRKAQNIAVRSDVSLATHPLHEWRTLVGGGLIAGGIRGPLTGHGLDIAIVDDPVKNRLEAESPVIREANWEWFNDVLITRIEPRGSCIVFMTRWHPDDLAGRLIEQGWDFVCLPAIDDDGAALWPSRWSVEELERKKAQVGQYTWASLFQGAPRPREGVLFGPPKTFKQLPSVYSAAIGVDLSYTEKTHADYSVRLTMFEAQGLYYVIDVARKQVRAPEFKKELRASRLRWKGAPMMIYAAGTETGAVDFIGEPEGDNPGIPLVMRAPRGDKFVRAQPVAAAWNDGKVLVPEDAPWLDDFLAEVTSFTGVKDLHDDQVDALAAAFDQLVVDKGFYLPKNRKVKPTGLRGMSL